MCADEAIHLRYEAQLLRTLRGIRAPWLRALVERAHRVFLGITAWIVFREHRAATQPKLIFASRFERESALRSASSRSMRFCR